MEKIMFRRGCIPALTIISLLSSKVIGQQADANAASTVQPCGYNFERKYAVDDKYNYKLETTNHHNGQFHRKETGIAHHHVVLESNQVPYDEITWTSLIKEDASGLITDLSADARSISAYRISLHPQGTLNLPALEVQTMVGMLTDLNTYFVAISPALGILKIHQPGDIYQHPNNHIGNWANGNTIFGQDCTQSTIGLMALTSQIASVKTKFLSPETECIQMAYPWMESPVQVGSRNNFQQITRGNDGTYSVMWGHEQFIIDSSLDSTTGKILSAMMDNKLTLRMKVGCDENLENCQSEFPFVIQRNESLHLQSSSTALDSARH
jgi:hypothetical protein